MRNAWVAFLAWEKKGGWLLVLVLSYIFAFCLGYRAGWFDSLKGCVLL